MEKEGEILEAVLVENGRIKKAGDFEKVKAFGKRRCTMDKSERENTDARFY